VRWVAHGRRLQVRDNMADGIDNGDNGGDFKRVVPVVFAVTIFAAFYQYFRSRRNAGATTEERERLIHALPSQNRDTGSSSVVTPIVRQLPRTKKISVGAHYDDGFILLAYPADAEQVKYFGDSGGEVTTSKQVFVNPEATPWLVKMARTYDLYIIICVDCDETETLARKSLLSCGIVEAGFNPVKLIFTDTALGRVSCVRQLEPRVHIDSGADVAYRLQRFIPRLVKVGEEQSGFTFAPNILSISSLSALFTDVPSYVSES